MPKIVLYQPDIAGNVGTIMRACACLNVELHIIEPCGFVFDVQKIKKSALDYFDKVQLFRHSSFENFYQKHIDESNRLVLLTTKSDKNYLDFKFHQNDFLLFGRESAGVTEEIHNLCKNRLTIKMQNNMRSLNIAFSAAMVLSEAIRQTNY